MFSKHTRLPMKARRARDTEKRFCSAIKVVSVRFFTRSAFSTATSPSYLISHCERSTFCSDLLRVKSRAISRAPEFLRGFPFNFRLLTERVDSRPAISSRRQSAFRRTFCSEMDLSRSFDTTKLSIARMCYFCKWMSLRTNFRDSSNVSNN